MKNTEFTTFSTVFSSVFSEDSIDAFAEMVDDLGLELISLRQA